MDTYENNKLLQNNIESILSFLVAVAALGNIFSMSPPLGVLYFSILCCVLFIFLVIDRKLRVNFVMLCLLLVILFSILLNEIPEIFKPYERYLAFIIVIALIGPLIRSTTLDSFRLRLFCLVNRFIVILVTASFFGLITGLYTGLQDRRDFTGFFAHSMILGPMSIVAMMNSTFHFHTAKTQGAKLFYMACAGIAFVTAVAAGSRSALLAGTAGMFFFFFKIAQGKIFRFLRYIVVIIMLIILSFPLWNKHSLMLLEKMEYAESRGDITSSRATVWSNRTSEFLSSPIIGVGFGSFDTSLRNNSDKGEGKIEPGSSWLAVLSMTGILGLIPLVFFFFRQIYCIFKDNKDSRTSAYLGALLVFYFLHMFFEGYIFSAGAGMFFCFWLLVAVVEHCVGIRRVVIP